MVAKAIGFALGVVEFVVISVLKLGRWVWNRIRIL
jgi:hypothetical protein